MGSSEMENSGKEKDPKTVPLSSPAPVPAPSQEPSSAVSAGGMAPDWSGFQAYSPMPPHGYVASSPQPHHPYMWGVQHMMPPYGTPPPPYVTMYPPGGMYAHPSMPQGSYPYSPYGLPSPNGIAEASGNTGSSIEGDGKQSEVKDKLPIKRSKGSLGSLNMIIGKNNEAGASANGACSKSAESASGGSSDGSDANSENDSGGSRHNGKDGEAASESGGSAHGHSRNGSNLPVNQSLAMVPMTATGVPSPPTNLNIGMDYWSGHGNVSTTVDGSQPQTWLQVSDERELKRQKRKQSNRESARRSRLRKQAECDELAQRADVLSGENATLRAELNRVKSEYEELLARNTSIKLQLASFPSLGGESLDKNEDEPESSSRQGVAETTRGPYNNSA